MNNGEALTKLWAWQHWYRTTDESGNRYGLSLLQRGFASAPKSLRTSSRDTVNRLVQLGTCINCGNAVTPGSTGDHLIPLARGGPQSIENFAPLCRSCNSSKGAKDLIEWWTEDNGKTIDSLNLDALCVYLRLMHQILETQRSLQNEAPSYYDEAMQQAAATMPQRLKDYFENQ